jgi:hypothetical protein
MSLRGNEAIRHGGLAMKNEDYDTVSNAGAKYLKKVKLND